MFGLPSLQAAPEPSQEVPRDFVRPTSCSKNQPPWELFSRCLYWVFAGMGQVMPLMNA